MLGWLALASAFERRSVWSIPNLLASTFYGETALRRDFATSTLSGVALHLLVYAVAGVVFGLLIRDNGNRLRVVLLGMLSGVGLYYLCFGLVWKSVNPLVPLYSPDRPMLLGHLLYGTFLGRFPVYLRAVCRQFSLV